jgi:hypothetical protein
LPYDKLDRMWSRIQAKIRSTALSGTALTLARY